MYDPAVDIGEGRGPSIVSILRTSTRGREKAAGWGLTLALLPLTVLGQAYNSLRRGARNALDTLEGELRREGPDGNFQARLIPGWRALRLSHKSGMDIYVRALKMEEEKTVFAAYPWGGASTIWGGEPLFVEASSSGLFARVDNFLWDLDRKLRAGCSEEFLTKAEQRMLQKQEQLEAAVASMPSLVLDASGA